MECAEYKKYYKNEYINITKEIADCNECADTPFLKAGGASERVKSIRIRRLSNVGGN